MSNQNDLSIETIQEHVMQILTNLQMLSLTDRGCKKQLQMLLERYQRLTTDSWASLQEDCEDFCQKNKNFIAKKRINRLRPWIKNKRSLDYAIIIRLRNMLPINLMDNMDSEDEALLNANLNRMEPIYLPELSGMLCQIKPPAPTNKQAMRAQSQDNAHQLGIPLPKNPKQQAPALLPSVTRQFMWEPIDDDSPQTQYYKKKYKCAPIDAIVWEE